MRLRRTGRPGNRHAERGRAFVHLLLGLALAALAGGAGAAHAGAASRPDSTRVPLRVAADASLETVLVGLEARYETDHPGTDLVFTFAPSGRLRAALLAGTLDADLFVSAGEEEVAALVRAGRADSGAAVTVATNRLALVTAARGRLSALNELREPKIRSVALGNPGTDPVGRAGVAALQRAGVWLDVRPRLRYCNSSQEIVDVVARNEVDAGVAWASDAVGHPGLKIVAGLERFDEPTLCVAVPVRDDAGKTTGADYLAYLLSEPARVFLAARHFGTP